MPEYQHSMQIGNYFERLGEISPQQVFAMAERTGTISGINRFPPALYEPIDYDIYASALKEREAQLDVEDIITDAGLVACSAIPTAQVYRDGNRRKMNNGNSGNSSIGNPEAVASTDSLAERLAFIDSITQDVIEEIDYPDRKFYSYSFVRDYDGEMYTQRKYIYDVRKIASIRDLEKEALELVAESLRFEAFESVPKMKGYPSPRRVLKGGEDNFVNIATLKRRLEYDDDHRDRPEPWKDLVLALVEDLSKRYKSRMHHEKRKSWYRNEPDWIDYVGRKYDRRYF